MSTTEQVASRKNKKKATVWQMSRVSNSFSSSWRSEKFGTIFPSAGKFQSRLRIWRPSERDKITWLQQQQQQVLGSKNHLHSDL